MNARPILFSAPMVRALLGGRKSQTRRIVNVNRTPKKLSIDDWSVGGKRIGPCPYATPGSLLWVRETFADIDGEPLFAADRSDAELEEERQLRRKFAGIAATYAKYRWRPSIHMPRRFSRLTLEITDVRLQPLQEISEEDAIAEGVEYETADPPFFYVPGIWPHSTTAVEIDEGAARSYAKLWDHINGADSWDANPFVWALTFKVTQRNVDDVLKAAA
jgi:hypothetical protein